MKDDRNDGRKHDGDDKEEISIDFGEHAKATTCQNLSRLGT